MTQCNLIIPFTKDNIPFSLVNNNIIIVFEILPSLYVTSQQIMTNFTLFEIVPDMQSNCV